MIDSEISSDQNEFYVHLVADLDVMLENATKNKDLVLAAHLQTARDFAAERIAFSETGQKRI